MVGKPEALTQLDEQMLARVKAAEEQAAHAAAAPETPPGQHPAGSADRSAIERAIRHLGGKPPAETTPIKP